jgi:hypothetical protein
MKQIKPDPFQLELIKKIIEQNNQIIALNRQIIDDLSKPQIITSHTIKDNE